MRLSFRVFPLGCIYTHPCRLSSNGELLMAIHEHDLFDKKCKKRIHQQNASVKIHKRSVDTIFVVRLTVSAMMISLFAFRPRLSQRWWSSHLVNNRAASEHTHTTLGRIEIFSWRHVTSRQRWEQHLCVVYTKYVLANVRFRWPCLCVRKMFIIW